MGAHLFTEQLVSCDALAKDRWQQEVRGADGRACGGADLFLKGLVAPTIVTNHKQK